MINPFKRIFSFLLKKPKQHKQTDAYQKADQQTFEAVDSIDGHFVSYDENLLEKSRTQWQFGDWDSLVKLDRETLQHHPDRAKLALLAAAGHQQIGDMAQARQFIRLSQDWGISKKLLTRMLVASAHNSLGRAMAVAGEQTRALQHFQASIMSGTPGSDANLLAQARISHQYQQLNLPPVAIGVSSNAESPSQTFLNR
jgi:hypothetical protein